MNAWEQVSALRMIMDDVGDPVWAATHTAAALYESDGFVLRPPFHLLVPRERRVTRLGHVIHRTIELQLIDRAMVQGIAATSATRTIIDLAASESPARLTTAVDSALRDGLTSEDFLHRRLVALRTPGRYGLPKLLDVIAGVEFSRGGHSWLERRFLELCASARLPRPITQQVVGRRHQTLIRVDCRFPDTPVVVELLGYRFHRSTQQMQVDAERMNRMVLDGLLPIQFTYLDIVNNDPQVLITVVEALSPWL